MIIIDDNLHSHFWNMLSMMIINDNENIWESIVPYYINDFGMGILGHISWNRIRTLMN